MELNKIEAEPESQEDYERIETLIKAKNYTKIKEYIENGYIPTNDHIKLAMKIDLDLADFIVECLIIE